MIKPVYLDFRFSISVASVVAESEIEYNIIGGPFFIKMTRIAMLEVRKLKYGSAPLIMAAKFKNACIEMFCFVVTIDKSSSLVFAHASHIPEAEEVPLHPGVL